MPVYPNIRDVVIRNLEALFRGEKVPVIEIGELTEKQMSDINAVRRGLKLNEISSPVVVYLGRHHHKSRSDDGYTAEDMWKQIESCLSELSVVVASRRMTTMSNPVARDDGYGSMVHDQAVFELTQRRPRAELYSVIPRGDVKPCELNP